MSCGLWPSLACAQQVVTNDLIVNLSWGGAFLQRTQSLFVTTGSWDNLTRISTLRDAYAWMVARTHSCAHTHLLTRTSGYSFRCTKPWEKMEYQQWAVTRKTEGRVCVPVSGIQRYDAVRCSDPSGTVGHCWASCKPPPSSLTVSFFYGLPC